MPELNWEDFDDRLDFPRMYDPAAHRIVHDELPTVTFRSFKRQLANFGTGISGSSGGSTVFGSGSVGRITRLHIFTSRASDFVALDVKGTIDCFSLVAGEDYYLQAEPKAPLYVARQRFAVCRPGGIGSIGGAGTYIISYEGLKMNSEVGYEHRGSR